MELVLNVSLPNGKRSVRMLCVKERVIESTENHRPVERTHRCINQLSTHVTDLRHFHSC